MTTKTISKFCLLAALGLASVVFNACKDDEPQPTPQPKPTKTETIDFSNLPKDKCGNVGKSASQVLTLDSIAKLKSNPNYEITVRGRNVCNNWNGMPVPMLANTVRAVKQAVDAGLVLEPTTVTVDDYDVETYDMAKAMGITLQKRQD
ncbi:MAG: hypothetical protein FWC39_10220 [Bacteroidetes bacterium]|nr:hypothetical protein [Bacteroidota bacterium]